MNRLNDSSDLVKTVKSNDMIGFLEGKGSKRRLSITFQCRKYFPELKMYGDILKFKNGKT